MNEKLITQLDTIHLNDQVYREQLDSIKEKYVNDSVQLKTQLKKQWKTINVIDSIYLIQVASIIDNYGLLGIDVVGDEVSETIFLVIQHADLRTQKQYLPFLQQAVKKGKTKTKYLAYLEDRIADREGRKQIYGTQLYCYAINDSCVVLPLEDPDNVDKRRTAIGLSSMENYLFDNFNKHWNVEQYKKDLPKIESLQKQLNNNEASNK